MRTQSLISMIKRETPDWSRELLRSLINDIHFIMLAHPIQQTRIIDPLTGKDPILITTDGIYQYLANDIIITTFPTATAAWLVDIVYTGNLSDSITKIDVINTQGTYSNPAIITFKENPGNSNYNIRAYKIPKEISTESVELELPEKWHLLGIYEGVMGWIEKTDNGRSDRWLNFTEKILPQFWFEMNRSLVQSIQPKYKGGF